MDIGSGKGFPSSNLSNFSPNPFIIDGVECSSMEGFLQSLKFKNPDMQEYVCTLVGRQAKKKGKGKNWQRNQELYWNGVTYKRDSDDYQHLLDRAFTALGQNKKFQRDKRDSDDYQHLLDRAFTALGQNKKFQRALIATKGSTLTHKIGGRKIEHTVLTQREFISRLVRLRSQLLGE